MALFGKGRRLQNLVPQEADSASPLSLRCMFCCTEKRLLSFHNISEGDHIKQPGENLSHNIGTKLKRFYDHHMIVKEVHEVTDSGSSAILTLIEFITTPFNDTAKIREHTVVKRLIHDEIYVITYRHKTHSPQEIIRRGQRLIKEDLSYNPIFRNCEHVARWCVCGNDVSFQAENFFEHGNVFLIFLNNYFLRIAALSMDDILVAAKQTGIECIAIVGIILCELLKSCTDTKVLTKLLECGEICGSCCKRRKMEIWIKFSVLLTLQTGGLIATTYIPGVSIQSVFGTLMDIFTVLLVKQVPKLMQNIYSPFIGRKVLVDSFRKIWVGDVISWQTYGIYHDGIVTRISVLRRSKYKKANLSVIHYTAPGLFKKSKVVEESITIHLDRDKLRLHDYTGYDFNEPEVVLQRARQRLGETKIGLTNRSAHFCHWAKLKCTVDTEINTDNIERSKLAYLRPLDPESEDSNVHPIIINHERTRPLVDIKAGRFVQIERPFTSKEIARERVVILDDIQAGHLVHFTFRNLPHHGVCTSVRPGHKPSIVHLDVVHYGTTKAVCEDTFTLDLNKVDIIVVKIHPVYKFKKEDIIRRARARVGQGGYNLLRHRSRHLAEEIVYRDKDQRIYSFSEGKPGDCVTYKYWALQHQAVIVGVESGQTKGNNEGYLTLVHYAPDSLFGTRYIKRERVFFNLTKSSVVVKAFHGLVVYPDHEVVQRALHRVGERKFKVIGNNSSDVVHWAKVVQTPCIVNTITKDDSDTMSTPRRGRNQYLLLPKVGEPFDTHFQKDWIKTWNELIPGVIVSKDEVTGIVSQVHKQNNELKVIQNVTTDDKSEIHKGRVTEISVKLDLRTDYIYVYRCDPRVANRPSVSLRKANQLLGLIIPGMGEWGFCKDCVLKH